MPLSDRLSQGRLSTIWYATISGLPYIFSTLPIPSAWNGLGTGQTSIDGEVYTWSPTLVLDDDSVAVDQRADYREGVGRSVRMGFRFKLRGNQVGRTEDLWMGLATNSPFRSDSNIARTVTDVEPADTTWTVDDTTGWPDSAAPDLFFAGLETCKYSTISGDTFQTVQRGLYGSHALYHRADLDGLVESGGGTLVARHPLVWSGRIITLYLGMGYSDGYDSQFVPYDTAAAGDDSLQVYRGIVTSVGWSKDLLHVELETLSLDSILNRQVATRLPRAWAGEPYQFNTVRVHTDRDQLAFGWSWGVVNSTAGVNDDAQNYVPALTLQNVSGALSGWQSLSDISDALDYTICDATGTKRPPQCSSDTDAYQVSCTLNADRKVVVEIRVFGIDADLTEDTRFHIDATPRNSFWRALGFEGASTHEPEVDGALVSVYTIEAERALPAFYMPDAEGSSGVTGMAVHHATGPDFDPDIGVDDDDGDPIQTGYIKVGEEIMGYSSTTGLGSGGWQELVITERGALGTTRQEHYLESKADGPTEPLEVVQGIGLPNVGTFRAFLYLLLGGAGDPDPVVTDWYPFVKGWYGWGAGVDPDLVDATGLIALNAEVPCTRDNLFISEPTTLKSIIAPELQVLQCYLAPGRDEDGSWRVRCYRVHPPLEYQGSEAVFSLDDSTTTVRGGTGLDTDEHRIVNVITIKAGYDNGTGKYRFIKTFIDGTSVATYGRKPVLEIELRAIGPTQDCEALASGFANNLFSNFSRPSSLVEKAVTTARGWEVELGNLVSVTDPRLPKVASNSLQDITPGRGVTDLAARVMALQAIYPTGKASETDAIRGVMTVVPSGTGEGRVSGYAPCIQGTVTDPTSMDLNEHDYSTSTALSDGLWFQVDDRIRVYWPGDEGSAVTTTIVSRDESSMVVADSVAALSGSAVIVEPAPYTDASLQDAQRQFVYVSDGDGKLDKSSGSDRSYRYL